MQEVRIQSLVRELKSHTPHGQNIKQKQHGNKFNKHFKNGPHQKNLLNFTLKIRRVIRMGKEQDLTAIGHQLHLED